MSCALCAAIAATLAIAGCAGDRSGAPASSSAGTISGMVQGVEWTSFSDAYWIGMPSAGSPEVIVFLFEGPMDCATLANVNWDKTAIGEQQLLEIGVLKSMTGTFAVPMDASVAYLKGAYNPSADAGKVTLDVIHAGVSLSGSFDVTFMGDPLKGTFDAKRCPDGVEP
jgi:hypothetical protein